MKNILVAAMRSLILMGVCGGIVYIIILTYNFLMPIIGWSNAYWLIMGVLGFLCVFATTYHQIDKQSNQGCEKNDNDTE